MTNYFISFEEYQDVVEEFTLNELNKNELKTLIEKEIKRMNSAEDKDFKEILEVNVKCMKYFWNENFGYWFGRYEEITDNEYGILG